MLTSNYISTLQNQTNNRPGFPLGNVCGRHEKLPLNGGVEGGLRTKGIYKKDTNELPLMTYVTVVKNRCDTIMRCMESVFNQDYPNIEYIVVDGASADGTLDIIKANEDKIDYFISQKDSSAVAATNKGVSLASGRYVGIINSDDVLVPNAAGIVMERYKSTGTLVICPMYANIKEDGTTEEFPDYPRYIIPKCPVINAFHTSAIYIAREAYETVGAFDESYLAINDCVWYNKCIDLGVDIELIDDVLSKFALGGISCTWHKTIADEANRFIREVFPFLSKKQAETYKNALSVGISIKSPYFRVLKKHFKENKGFRAAAYRTALYVAIRAFYRFIMAGNDKIEDINASYKLLNDKLSDSLKQGDDFDASEGDFVKINQINHLFRTYERAYKYANINNSNVLIKAFWLGKSYVRRCARFIVMNNRILLRLYFGYKRLAIKSVENQSK